MGLLNVTYKMAIYLYFNQTTKRNESFILFIYGANCAFIK